jgi:hypothetical protein
VNTYEPELKAPRSFSSTRFSKIASLR